MLILTKDNPEEEVLKTKGLVLVDYWNEACEPCKALMPDVEKLSKAYSSVKFCKLDTTKARRLVISQRVMGLPTISLYKDGAKIDELTKENATKESIEDMINKYL